MRPEPLSDWIDQQPGTSLRLSTNTTDKLPNDRGGQHVIAHHRRERRIEVGWERRKPPHLDL